MLNGHVERFEVTEVLVLRYPVRAQVLFFLALIWHEQELAFIA